MNVGEHSGYLNLKGLKKAVLFSVTVEINIILYK